ncbi:hypothetical protein DPMN_060459 [Dreissena polymorpha]|uniref:Ionotropic glutamate receptor L-glutamate and glycine-binding domain-containing protein n=1 Tax=Dreissena polymorpha TaxID=45954 RepID=A0A9D4HHI5_DREPO|nr:hypothetical protein DPMN_060459 [Dreissena polymorpha]
MDLTEKVMTEMNRFEYYIKEVEDRQYGSYIPQNNSWNGMVGELLTKVGFRLVVIFLSLRMYVCRVLGKVGILRVLKVSAQIIVCSPHRRITDDTFRLHLIFV